MSGRTRTVLLIALLAAAALVRVLYLQQYAEQNPYYEVQIADCTYYDAWALDLARGAPPPSLPYYQPPLYPFLLGGIYRALDAFGQLDHRFVVVYVIQLMLGLASVYLVVSIGRKLFDDVTGLLAGLLALLHANLLFWEVKLLIATLHVFLALLAIRLLLGARGRWHRFVLAGAAAGLLGIARADKIPFLILAAVWVAWTARPRLRSTALFALPILIVVGGVAARNVIVGGDAVLVSANGGVNFWFGNHAGASGVNMAPSLEFGSLATQRETAKRIAEEAAGTTLSDSEVSRHFFDKGLEFLRSSPSTAAEALAKKLRLGVSDLEADIGWLFEAELLYAPILAFLPVPFGLLLGLGAAGLVASARRREVWLLVALVLSCYAVIMLFFMGSRFRLAAAPALAILGSHGVMTTVRAVASGAWLRAASLALVTAVVVAHAVYVKRTFEYEKGRTLHSVLLANTTQLIGQAHVELGQRAEAREAFRRVLENYPISFKAYYCLGKMAWADARAADDPAARRRLSSLARKQLLQSRELMSAFPDTHVTLGEIAMEKELHDPNAAARHFRDALDVDPSPRNFVRLFGALVAARRLAEAEQCVAEFAGVHPGHDRVAELEAALKRARRP